MAWEEKKVEDQRKCLIEAYMEGEQTMTELCHEYGISRKTGYKWRDRYQQHGVEGLKDLSRAPHEPYRIYDEKKIDLAIKLKLKHVSWGPKKILAKLAKDHPDTDWPSATRLYEVFMKHHLVKSKRIKRRVPATHPLGEVDENNDVWIADFKGVFLTKDRSKCEPFTVTDGFSRYLIKCKHLEKKTVSYVWAALADAFHEYGLPNRLRTDNGPPFGSVGVGRLTKLSVNLIKAGVIPEWINPGHPEENGRHERFHLTLKNAVANPPADTLEEQERRLAFFEEEYNFERPHESLGMKTPASCYHTSARRWDGILRPPEYDVGQYVVRKVGQNGCIWVQQKEYYLGMTLTGEYVGIKDEEGLKIYYGPVCLGNLKINEGLEKPKLNIKSIIRRG